MFPVSTPFEKKGENYRIFSFPSAIWEREKIHENQVPHFGLMND